MNKSNLAVASLFLTIFVDAAGIGIVFPALTPLLLNNESGLFAASTDTSVRFYVYGLVLSVYPLMMFVGSPMLGDMSDRFGRKPILLFCLGGNAAGLIGTALGVCGNSLFVILLGRMLCGVTAASLPVAQAAIIDMSTPGTRSRNLSMITAANGVGFAVGPVLGGMFQGAGSREWLWLSMPFFVGALLPVATLLFVLLCFAEHRPAPFSGVSRGANSWKRLIESVRYPELLWPFCILAVFLVGYYVFFNYMSAFSLLMFGFDAFWEAMLLSYYSACFALSLLFIIPVLTRRFTLRQNLTVSLLCQPALVAAIVVIGEPWSMWVAVGPLALLVANTYVTLLSIASNHTSVDRQGQVMGFTASINALAWGVAPIATALLQPIAIVLPMLVSSLILSIAAVMSMRYSLGECPA